MIAELVALDLSFRMFRPHLLLFVLIEKPDCCFMKFWLIESVTYLKRHLVWLICIECTIAETYHQRSMD
jgi:hypothetical protein